MHVICEICGTNVYAGGVAARMDVDGRAAYFCCEACRRAFLEHPDLYPEPLTSVSNARTAPAPLAAALTL